jgi:hypothetical protein
MDPIQKLLPALEGVKPSGQGKWSARCPAHEDRHQSLGIGTFADGGVWVKCFKGCDRKDILAKLGVSEGDLHATMGPSSAVIRKPLPAFTTFELAVAKATRWPPGTHTGTWVYTDAGGGEVARVIRIDYPKEEGDPSPKPPKSFRPVHRNAEGWVLRDPPGVLPLYNLPQVIQAKRVYITEGEKAADAAISLGLVATTSMHGAKAPQMSDLSVLAGKELMILPDADEAGGKYAAAIQELTADLQPPPVIRLVHLPGLQDKDDIVEFIARQREAGRESGDIKLAIEALASAAAVVNAQEWPDPQPLPETILPVQAFRPELLPDRLRRSVIDGAERISCPLDYVAIPAVIGLAGLVGRKVGIRPKRYDSWTVVPNLWGGIVGRPGTMKTSAIKEGLQPLKHREAAAKKLYTDKVKKQRAAEMVRKAKQQKIGQDIRDALEESEEAALQRATDAIDDEEPVPVRRRYIVTDTTVEKLGEILNQNSDGVLVYRDELTGFLMSLDKEGQEAARSFYLEAWDGTSSYTFDRIGRGTLEIESTCVSIVGGIQPGPLSQHMRAAARGGAADDGLVQRFQLLVWPDPKETYVNVDRQPEPGARDEVLGVYGALADVEHLGLGAEHDPHDSSGVPFLRFDDEGQQLFDEWRTALEHRLREGTEDPVFESHLSKFRSLIPSLALLFHLVQGRRGAVGRDVLAMAISWCHIWSRTPAGSTRTRWTAPARRPRHSPRRSSTASSRMVSRHGVSTGEDGHP